MAAGLQMPSNSLTLVVDEQGIYYRVPISCINEPINYNVNYVDQKLKQKPKPPEKFFNVRVGAFLCLGSASALS